MSNTIAICLFALIALSLASCSSSDDSADPNDPAGTELNPDLESEDTSGEPGGDTSAIAGLWDDTLTLETGEDVIYWHLANNGVLTRYDYQQDAAPDATGENCYLAGSPITVTPEGGDDYSVANIHVTAVRTGDTLAVVFQEPDVVDLDGDGDTTDMPAFSWTLLTTPTIEDLNNCAE